MTYTLYGIPNCDTVKKAKDWLNQHEVEYRFHNYKKEGITKDKLRSWLAQVAKEKLVNKAGTTYRKLSDEEKASISDSEHAIDLMFIHTSMIKRPVLEGNNKVLSVGFKPEIYHKTLGIKGDTSI